VYAASTPRSTRASNTRKSQASCSVPAQIPRNTHPNSSQSTKKSTDLLSTWGWGNIFQRIYFTLSRIVHCVCIDNRDRGLNDDSKETRKTILSASCLSPTARSNMFWMCNSWLVRCFPWACAPQTEHSVLCVKLSFTIFRGPLFLLSLLGGGGIHLHLRRTTYESAWQDSRHECSIIFRGENNDSTKTKSALPFV
jgi:hypothetical protein